METKDVEKYNTDENTNIDVIEEKIDWKKEIVSLVRMVAIVLFVLAIKFITFLYVFSLSKMGKSASFHKAASSAFFDNPDIKLTQSKALCKFTLEI